MTTERVDDQVKPAQRIAGPTGFLLVLLVFLLLPGVAASCSVSASQEGAGSLSADANGVDLVLGSDPYFEAEGAFEMPPTLHASTVEQAQPEESVRSSRVPPSSSWCWGWRPCSSSCGGCGRSSPSSSRSWRRPV